MARRQPSLPLSDHMINLVAARFRALGEPVRLRILQVLETGEMSVGAIAGELSANHSNISRHLQTLHEVGILGRRREGSNILYCIADPTVARICSLVCQRAEADARSQLAELGDRTRS